jgi:hypothetical protein
MIPAEHVGTNKDPRPRPLTPMSTGRESRRHDSAEAHFAARERYQRERGPQARRERAAIRREVQRESTTAANLIHRSLCLSAYEERRALDADWQRLVASWGAPPLPAVAGGAR